MKFIPILFFVFIQVIGLSLEAQSIVEIEVVSGQKVSGILNSELRDVNLEGLSISQDGEIVHIEKGEISSVRYQDQVFNRFIVQVDHRSLITSQLTQDKEPRFETDTVLLEKIVSGPVNLFWLKDRNKREHFFIQRDGGQPEELIYTRYLKYDDNGRALPVKENNRFKTQLLEVFESCASVFEALNEAEYKWGEITEIVVKGSTECLGATASELTYIEAPNSYFKTEITAGVGSGLLYLYGDQFPYDLADAKSTIKPGYYCSVALAYYPAVQKGDFALITELGVFNLSQTISIEEYTSADIYRNYSQLIDYHYLSLNLIGRKTIKGKNSPFVQLGYSYGYAYRLSNPLEEETYFYGTLRTETETEGFPTRNQENALVIGGGIMPGNLVIRLSGRISTGSTLLPTQSSLHFLGHLCFGYRF